MSDANGIPKPAMSEYAIEIENLSKRYTIDHLAVKGDALRHSLESAVRSPIAWLRSRREKKMRQVDFWALKDVSLKIKKGEVIGLIGSNGAGKSTLLKVMSRITFPTSGRICIDGRIASLLEVGTGFHAELTGRENIFLNGAILGMSRAEVASKFDEIVEFSGVAEFLDTPVKRYSSGMYVRLAFSVAVQLDPEIMIVDEVLSVGDAAFRKKCMAKMGTFGDRGKTVLFVSHNMEAIRMLCKRCIWMKNGHVQMDGPSDEVIKEYLINISSEQIISQSNMDYGLAIRNVALKNSRGEETDKFQPDEDLTVDVLYDAQNRIEKPVIALGICGNNGACFTANMLLDGHRPAFLEGKGQISCTFKSIPLLPQKYTVKLIVRSENVRDIIVKYQDVAEFSVEGDLSQYGYKGEFEKYAPHSTPVVVPYEWRLPDGTTAEVALKRETVQLLDPRS
jgi:lipopolysaccharide transport system ATP-binding protein